MNNLMLSFSGQNLTRLRTLVGAVGREVALTHGGAATSAIGGPATALDTTWTRLVEMLDLGAEPEMRECPHCKHKGMLRVTRCGYCWSTLPALKSKENLVA